MLETILALGVGVGLSAAAGLRVFAPMWVTALAGHYDVLPLGDGFQWLASLPALIALSCAMALEIAAYYFPWVDNVLDTIATPLAAVAGVLLTASVLTDVDPMARWALAIIAGGGAATAVQGTTVAIRGGSTLTTGGLANGVLATLEWVGALAVSALAILVPVVSLLLLLGLAVYLTRRHRRKRRADKAA